ncbi:sensor histidine kinase [Stieleria magnilauensis]
MDDSLPRELHPLLETLNALLDRLEQAFEHERSFSADVAHELRTPLAGLRAKTELAIAKPRTADEHQQTLTQCHRMILQTSAIVESLLATATSSGETMVSGVNPESVLLKLAEDMVAETTKRQLNFKFRIPQFFELKCDPRTVEIILRNLMENAVAYADCESEIDVIAEQSPVVTTIRIANAATGFPAEDISQVFDRFWRRDTSRSETGNHSGLGLSLCKRLVESMNGTIEATCQHDVFTVNLRLPNAQLTNDKQSSANMQMLKRSDCSGTADRWDTDG